MSAWIEVTGWTLIHFVWQGGLLAAATAVALRVCRQRSSHTRYGVACLGLAAMLASAMTTAATVWIAFMPVATGHAAAAVPFDAPMAALRSGIDVLSIRAGASQPLISLEAWLPAIVWGWLAGVTLLVTRFSGGCWRIHRLRVLALRRGDSRWQSIAEGLAKRLHIDMAFRVVESRLVDGPMVIGWMRPVILLPVAVLANMTPGQIESLLAHELAHVRRRDYAVNLLQTVTEALFFFHPGVWWVSSRIRQEREHCCDDVAVEVCGEPASYAEALAELASWRIRHAALSLGAGDGRLLARVRRLLDLPDAQPPRPVSGLVVVAAALLLAASIAVISRPTPAYAERAIGAGQPAAEPLRVRHSDHFEIHYPPDLDLHADRVAREAERAYELVSAGLKHELAFKVPLVLFRTTAALQETVRDGRLGQSHPASFADPSGDRILMAVDSAADQWLGIITHELTHIFAFDIVPGSSTPRWILEGLAEYQRATWDPQDLVALRDAVRANSIPAISGIDAADSGRDQRFVRAIGHAAFDFIDSRWGKPGVRQFLFALRQTARNGGDPYQAAFRLGRNDFDREFERYLRERFAGAAGRAPRERFDYGASVRIEGAISGLHAGAGPGLACIELWVTNAGRAERWGVECGNRTGEPLPAALKPGDRIVVTGAPAREPGARRVALRDLLRPSDGFSWRIHAG